MWADDHSRREYGHLVRWHLLLDSAPLPPGLSEETYFPTGIVAVGPNEHFVDCGAFDGDSLKNFLQLSGGRFGRIDALEPDRENAARLRSYVASLNVASRNKIYVHEVAVGAERTTLRFHEGAGPGSSVTSGGEHEVTCVPLDEELANTCPSYLKVDVEGAELDVLAGARRLIAEHAPTLAIVLYHHMADLWTVPLAIKQIRPDYELYLRRYAEDCWETVCYAVVRK